MDTATGCNVNRKLRDERNRSRKIKVHVTLKDLGKSHVKVCTSHFNTFYPARKRKIHATASTFSRCSSLTLPRRGAGSSWKRISGRADSSSTFLAKTWTFCPSFREDRIPAKTFRRCRGKCETSSLISLDERSFASLDLTFVSVVIMRDIETVKFLTVTDCLLLY